MTIDEATIALMSLHKCLEGDTDSYFLDALKLGEEALKRFQALRADLDPDEYQLLLGETKE